MNRIAIVLLLVACLLASTSAPTHAWSTELNLLAAGDRSRDALSSFLADHCVRCHGQDVQEGDLRFDTLQLPGDANLETWQRVTEQLQTENMPPSDEPQPSAASRAAFLQHASNAIAKAAPAVPALRRMSRTEYEFTVQDLLGIDTPLKDLLPEDSEVQGFDNVATGLDISSILMERYLEAANEAFHGTIRRIEPLPPETRRIELVDQKDNQESIKQQKGGVISREGAFIDFTPGWPPARIDPAHPIEDGIYRCRVAVWPHEPGSHRTLAVAIYVGPLFGTGKREFMGMFDVTGTPENPRIIEFTTRMAEGHTMHVLPMVFPEHVTWRDKEEPRPGVAVQWAETYGPLDQEFPSLATQSLFGTNDSIKSVPVTPIWMRHRRGVKTHEIQSSRPSQDAEQILRRLVPRAFRRPVSGEQIQPFINLVNQRLEDGSSFEEAVQAGVTAVLCSPHFLLLNIQSEVDDFELASRLSYFLWSSMPDEELLSLAQQNRLHEPEVLHAQVDRMIDDPKIERFINHFTDQWLDLSEIEFTTPDDKLYPEYDELLLRSMLGETRGFFRHLLENDLSVMNFIDSDFAILNQRLAAHYEIEGIEGHEHLRVVPLPSGHLRGGILTQASVLKVTANGTNTSPVIRGSWVLENLLGQPPLPPPAGVPAVEPDIRGTTTIRAQLRQHRADPSCARCHDRIDPPGFALEEFDVIGGHRNYYRSLGNEGERVPKTNYRIGPEVESHGELSVGTEFANFQAYQQLLTQQDETIAKTIAKKLLIYAAGRPVSAAHQEQLVEIINRSKQNDLGLRAMIHHVVDSKLFREP